MQVLCMYSAANKKNVVELNTKISKCATYEAYFYNLNIADTRYLALNIISLILFIALNKHLFT